MPPEAEGYLDDEKADLLATVTALVAAERERILGLMAHGSPCQQNDATCPHDPDGSWADCLTDAIRQAPRP
jgi:alpha-L-fucosidase